jgi:hypothetical protein
VKIKLLLLCAASCWIALAADQDPPSDPVTRNAAGYTYKHETVIEVPWSIHILKIDRSSTDLQLQTILADGNSFGLSSLHEQARLVPAEAGRPIAAINGDFYDKVRPYQGDPKGLQIMRGELISAPNDWSCIWINEGGDASMGRLNSQLSVTWPNGTRSALGLNERRLPGAAVLYTPALGKSTRTSGGREFILEAVSGGAPLPIRVGEEYSFRVTEVKTAGNSQITSNALVLSIGPTLGRTVPKIEAGATLKVSTATMPSIKGSVTALSGGPALVHGGKLVHNRSELRHPRTALGWTKTHFYFVVVDGRQPNLSLGMTYNEMANYMLKLGCEEALNLDGGGSATLWVLGQIMNSPSQGFERSVANALVLVQTPKGQ